MNGSLKRLCFVGKRQWKHLFTPILLTMPAWPPQPRNSTRRMASLIERSRSLDHAFTLWKSGHTTQGKTGNVHRFSRNTLADEGHLNYGLCGHHTIECIMHN